MPRFENEGFNPAKRNRNERTDRTVPENENYYNYSPIDLNFNNKEHGDAISSNQRQSGGINPCHDPRREKPISSPERFVSERADDFISRQNTKPQFHQNEQDFDDFVPKRDRQSKPPKGKNPKGKISIGKRILLVLIAIVLIITGGVAAVMGKVNYNDKVTNQYVDKATLEGSALVKNILLLGVDARSGENGEEARSDTMMLISLDMKHHCIKLTSFLRDAWVYVPTLGYEQRLNAACSSGGYQGVVDAIEYNFGIDIDGYAVVDFNMFEVLVDSLGGVEVDVTEKEAKEVTGNPYRYGNVTLESGKYMLTGEQALAYCRIRKIDTDFVRTQRQRTVMNAIIDKAKHSGPLRLYRMAFKSAGYIETDLTKGQLLRLTADAGYCITGDMHQAKMPFDNTWEYATIRSNSVISINTEKNKEQLINYIYSQSSADINAQEENNK